MAELLWVRPGRDDGRVALWEKSDLHPGGEAFVAGPPVQVALTPAVERALADGRLVRVEEAADPTPDNRAESLHAALLLTRFEALTAKEIVEAAASWSDDVRAQLREYEAAHKARVTVLDALQSGSEPEKE